MKQEIFDDCLKHWKESDGHTEFWKSLSVKWDYPNAESLRQEFKYERKKKGIKKDKVEEIESGAKILFLDIETSPIQAFVWGLWDQNINPEAIIQDWHLICWSAKWIFSSEVFSEVLNSEEALRHDDHRITESVWKLMDQADIVVTHNGNSFDIKRLNTRFLYNNLYLPAPYQSIDTLVVAKNQFNFTSNKLDYINQFLGLPKKKEVGFELWSKCFYGDSEALRQMEEYNCNDVEILEDLYLKLRPYIKGHPNLNLWSTENISVCPNCGSEDLKWKNNYYTFTGYYKAFRCKNCGALGRSRQLEVSKEKRKSVVVS